MWKARTRAVLAKEKFEGRDASEPEGTAFVIKHDEAEFRASGGWAFLYFPASGKTAAAQAACAGCHRASSEDYVLGKYDGPAAGDGR
jgi:Cytochrome P460